MSRDAGWRGVASLLWLPLACGGGPPPPTASTDDDGMVPTSTGETTPPASASGETARGPTEGGDADDTTRGTGPGPSPGEDTAPAEGWVRVWSDEFEGSEIDPSRWQHERNCWGGGNGEQQCYTDDPANAFVAAGSLHIVAIEGATQGPPVNDDDPAYDPDDTSATLPYSSARLRTRHHGDWRYGRVEVRAQLPAGQGTWPAIWMLPTEAVYGGWAASGEIDIMEAVNLGVGGENRVYGTLHYGSYWPDNVHSGAEYVLPGGASPADDFHEYALEWEQGEIRWYVDGFHYATQRQDGWYTLYEADGRMLQGEGAAPFDETFHLILNLTVGGAWAGNVNDGGIDPTAFPQELVIDYVRVYECGVDPATGDGCDTIGDDYEVVPGNPPP